MKKIISILITSICILSCIHENSLTGLADDTSTRSVSSSSLEVRSTADSIHSSHLSSIHFSSSNTSSSYNNYSSFIHSSSSENLSTPYYSSIVYEDTSKSSPLDYSSSSDSILHNHLTLENALKEQFISFDVPENMYDSNHNIYRARHITELKQVGSNHSAHYFNDAAYIDTTTHKYLTIEIQGTIPVDQMDTNHWEWFMIHFRQPFLKSEINPTLSFKVGKISTSINSFNFFQSYLWAQNMKEESTIEITEVQKIIDHTDKVFITGRFSGSLTWVAMNEKYMDLDIRNGEFKMLITTQ